MLMPEDETEQYQTKHKRWYQTALYNTDWDNKELL